MDNYGTVEPLSGNTVGWIVARVVVALVFLFMILTMVCICCCNCRTKVQVEDKLKGKKTSEVNPSETNLQTLL